MQIRTVDIADYDALIEFWQKIPGVRLADADSRPAIDRYLRRNPGMSFLAENEGKTLGPFLPGMMEGVVIYFTTLLHRNIEI